jgi:hypothetical protein
MRRKAFLEFLVQQFEEFLALNIGGIFNRDCTTLRNDLSSSIWTFSAGEARTLSIMSQ